MIMCPQTLRWNLQLGLIINGQLFCIRCLQKGNWFKPKNTEKKKQNKIQDHKTYKFRKDMAVTFRFSTIFMST